MRTRPVRPHWKSRFFELAKERIGLALSDRDWPKIDSVLQDRLGEQRVDTPEQYLGLLHERTAIASQEWNQLARGLTVGETFFFRDRGQIGLLRNRLLPEIIARNAAKGSLRVWSAGCSTGEEPYSIAMVLNDLLPDPAAWTVQILGTDINSGSIEKARSGVYGAWSFRGVDSIVKERYFEAVDSRWRIHSFLRSLVEFRTENLVESHDRHSEPDSRPFDLILCRNVFIYFDRETVVRVVANLSDALVEGGYLMSGHAELHDIRLSNLAGRCFPESIVYQRTAGSLPVKTSLSFCVSAVGEDTGKSSTKASGVRKPATPAERKRSLQKHAAHPASDNDLENAEELLHAGRHSDALEAVTSVLNAGRPLARAWLVAAQALANLGQSDRAELHCQKALEIDPFSTSAYFLLAHLKEDENNLECAKDLYKRIIYLVPEFAPAYLELAGLYERGRDAERAHKFRSTALTLFAQMPPLTVIQAYAPMTAGELVTYIQVMISDKDGGLLKQQI